ncbi:site-2 protease family protein [Fodinicola feengrottensis]|uniref:site-2 protease family protein n=1 Tax=Fodinicola feengrottensis TaxID=435914 RepID=UPI0013D6753A|nr:site-2 protease family protein [Fodinicola feengrottensis]
MWFVIAAILVYSYGSWVRYTSPTLNTVQTYLVSFVFVLLLLGSVFLHELGHALASKAYGIRVYAMTLWMLGGLTETDAEDRRPGVDFVIALAGPAVNLVLGVIGGVAAFLISPQLALTQAFILQLAWANLYVGVFNLLPGLPLDGGTMLRAVVWKVTSNRFLSTRVAGWVGRVVAIAVVGVALFGVTNGATRSPSACSSRSQSPGSCGTVRRRRSGRAPWATGSGCCMPAGWQRRRAVGAGRPAAGGGAAAGRRGRPAGHCRGRLGKPAGIDRSCPARQSPRHRRIAARGCPSRRRPVALRPG